MRYFLFLLLTAILVACTAEVSQETPSPVAIIIETLPPAGDTPTATATRPATDTPTTTATRPATDNPTETATILPTDTTTPLPTLSPTPATPFTQSYLIFFWDTESYVSYADHPGFPEPGGDLKRDLHIAIPGPSPDAPWQVTPLLHDLLDWESYAPRSPGLVLSPDKTKIAFNVAVNREHPSVVELESLYVYDLVNRQLTQLTEYSMGLESQDFNWLPDGETLAYAWDNQIYTINLNSLAPELLVDMPEGLIETLKWSPQENIALFIFRSSSSNVSNLFLLDAETQTTTRLTHAIEVDYSMESADWASTGEWFVFTGFPTNGLFLTNSHTLETVTLVPPDIRGATSWSPDGSKLAFTANSGETFLLDISTWQTTKIFDRSIKIFDRSIVPKWSPDGSKLAFDFVEGQKAYLTILDLVTNEMSTVLELDPVYRFYVWNWSPDGKWLLYFAAQENETGLYLLSYETGESYFILDTFRTMDPFEVRWLP